MRLSTNMDAINLTSVAFSYGGSNSVLKDINARVPYGRIYSLLGPSGAGKTTLLRLILGRIQPTSGTISVLGHKPGLNNRVIGYMPQDTALCMSFTVGQTLQYFSNIYRLSRRKADERKNELKNILGLPDDDLTIKELSGGQQKMVSLALSFLHWPRLLILDEPTVGSDPVLGDCIWKYLHSCCKEGISIIIVTHYIEEAAFGHSVGIMRDGKILDEGSPKSLIRRYQRNTLEEVFLYLCETQDSNKDLPMADNSDDATDEEFLKERRQSSINISKYKEIKISPLNFIQNFVLNLWILSVLCRKNLSRFFQFNVSTLFFLIPAFQALILCSVYNRDAVPIRIGVFNQDAEPKLHSKGVLNTSQIYDVYYLEPIQMNSLEELESKIRSQEVIGGVWFQQNYSQELENRILDPEEADNATIKGSEVKLFVDTVNYLFYFGFLDTLRQNLYTYLGKVHAMLNVTANFEAPIVVKEVLYAEGSKISDFLLPGYMIAFIYMSQVSLSSQLLIVEKKDGLFERSLVAGVGHNLVFLSHLVSSAFLSVIQILLMHLVSLFIFDITNFGTYDIIFILNFAQAFNSIALGLLMSAWFTEGFVALLASIFVTISQLFTSGAIFPMEMVHPALHKWLYATSPIAIPSDSLRNAMLRAWPITHPLVFNGLAINVLSGTAFLILAMIIFSKFS